MRTLRGQVPAVLLPLTSSSCPSCALQPANKQQRSGAAILRGDLNICRNNAARAENKGRRRSSEGSRRWQRSVLPCITADCELDSFDPLPQTSPPVGRSQQGRLALNDCSPGKHQPLQHMSSPFAGVPGDFDDQPQLASASCSNGSQSQARTRGNKALEQGRGSQLETIKGTSLKDTSPRCMIM